MFKSVLIVVALLLVGSLATQAGASGADTDTLPDERVTAVAPAILNHDFSPAIATLPTYMRGDSELADRYIGSLKLGITAAGDGDEQVLAAREINGLYWTEGETLNLVSQYHYNHGGAFPTNGATLFPELATPAGEAAFFAMTDQEKREKYYTGVNPYTGKFNASFGSAEWRAGGLGLSPLPLLCIPPGVTCTINAKQT